MNKLSHGSGIGMKPNYENSIVNLSSSIAQAFGIQGKYPPLGYGALDDLDDKKNIVLLVVDGLGYNYLKEKVPSSLLGKHVVDSMTSVFLSSTGSAITSIMTGLAPRQHCVTGWFVYLREYGIVSRILPYSNAIDYNLLGSDITNVVDIKSIFEPLGENYSLILPQQIVDSTFTRNLTGNAHRIEYTDTPQFFDQVADVITNSRSRNYIYGYWPRFDAVSHTKGVTSEEAYQQLREFDTQLSEFLDRIDRTDTKVIITGDHGFNDVAKSNTIYTRDHPKFEECLTLPLCGDTRTVYAYVRPAKKDQFERYVSNEFEDACELFLSSDLVADNWFGCYDSHHRLQERVGDYTLIFKEGHAIINCFPGFEPIVMTGHHGGVSADEMLVPLCVFDR